MISVYAVLKCMWSTTQNDTEYGRFLKDSLTWSDDSLNRILS